MGYRRELISFMTKSAAGREGGSATLLRCGLPGGPHAMLQAAYGWMDRQIEGYTQIVDHIHRFYTQIIRVYDLWHALDTGTPGGARFILFPCTYHHSWKVSGCCSSNVHVKILTVSLIMVRRCIISGISGAWCPTDQWPLNRNRFIGGTIQKA